MLFHTSQVALYFPRHLNVETSDYCNRSCAFCPLQKARDNAPPRLLAMTLFEDLCREVAESELEVKISLQWVDEPLANPRLHEYIERGRTLAPDATWLLQTNGDLLDERKLELLKRGFDAVVVNLYSEGASRRLKKLGLDYVPARFPKKLQSPGRLQRAPGFDDRRREAIVHINEKFHDENWVQWNDHAVTSARPCTRVWEDASIAWDGTVYTCCRDNERDHPVGDLREGSLFDAFNSDRARVLREQMEAGQRADITMCHACEKAFAGPFHALNDADATRLAGRPTRTADVVRVRQDRRPDRVHLPWGRYDYFTARALARELGHVTLPGLLPLRYEHIVGVTPTLARDIRDICQEVAGDALVGIVVCGGRVMTRQRLALVDPSVFLVEKGPLRVRGKARLREMGRDPAQASDLDLKVLVDEARVSSAEAARLAPLLGERLHALGAPLPISGHKEPLIRLLRVPSTCTTARAAFDAYNGSRTSTSGKGPLSLEYSQLLYDRDESTDPLAEDATASVRAALVSPERVNVDAPLRVLLADLTVADDAVWAAPESKLYRESPAPLSYHQLVCALIDFPDHEPPGVIVRGHHLIAGALCARAARAAGRLTVAAREPV